MKINIGFLGLTFIALLALQLAGVISISWWLVTLPLWIIPAVCAVIFLPILLVVGVVLAAAFCLGIVALVLEKFDK